jgi:hypothetical protein
VTELQEVADRLRRETREAQGLPPELTSSEPFQLVAGLIREQEAAPAIKGAPAG